MAGCIRYRPVPPPPAPPQSVADYAARTLADPALHSYIRGVIGSDADTGWTEDRIALTALYFRGDLALSRAAVDEAHAGELTAGAWPPFSVQGDVSRTARPLENTESRWSQTISATATLELGGKRGARIAGARAASLVARLRRDATAWQLANDARAAALGAVSADDDLADATAAASAVAALTELLRGRYAEGQLPLAELARAETDARAGVVEAVEAERQRIDARVTLARALGVAVDRVDSLPLRVTSVSSCAVFDGLSAHTVAAAVRDSLAALALQSRPDIGAALAEYAVADADVRLAVARQYPDLTLGPGLLWDQGIPGWIVSVGLPALIGGRNRGPIAESEARRAEEAARVRLVQDSVLGAIDGAVAGCRGVRRIVATADSLVYATQHVVDLADSAYQRGETGRTELAIARLALVRATHTRQLANTHRVAAGAALDRATGRWIGLTPHGPWPGPAIGADLPH